LGNSYQAQGATNTPQIPTDNPTKTEPVANVSTWDFITMILGLLVVVGVIYLIFFVLKRGMGKKIIENELIKILGSRIITGTKSLHLVDVGGSIFLVGSANDSISLISEIAEKEAKDTIRLAAAARKESLSPRFADMISSIFKPKVKKQLEINESIDFIKRQRKRLNKMNQ
jgi:flagellar protein FliO/FliZ